MANQRGNNENDTINALSQLADLITAEIRAFTLNHERLKAQFENVEKDVDRLSVIIRDGNGKPSMLTSMGIVESDVKKIKEELEFLHNKINEFAGLASAVHVLQSWKESQDKKESEQHKSKLQFNSTAISAVVSVIALLINVILALMGIK